MAQITQSLYSGENISTPGSYELSTDASSCTHIKIIYSSGEADKSPAITPTINQFPLLDDVSVSSTISWSEGKSALIDDDPNGTWTSAGSFTGHIGQWFQISLQSIDKSNLQGLAIFTPNANYRGGINIELSIIHDGGTSEVVTNYFNARGVTYIFDVTDIDLTTVVAIRATSRSGGAGHFSIGSVYFKMLSSAPEFHNTSEYGSVVVRGSAMQVASITDTLERVIGYKDGHILYNLYRKGSDDTPTLIMKEPESVGSSLGTESLVGDLESLASKDYVTTTIDTLGRSTLGGRVDTELDLPTTDVREGTIYLVGALGSANYEEYIYTQDGAWDRLGTIRQSDVDLSGYTPTVNMTVSIDDMASNASTNIEGMQTEIEASIDTLEVKMGATVANLPTDTQFLESTVPTAWPENVDDGGMVFIIEPDTIPYAAPELRTGNGTPFVDAYAVSASSVFNGQQANRATYDSIYADHSWHSGNGLPHYFYMTFKEPLRATGIYLKNRSGTDTDIYVYAVNAFVIEGKDDAGVWIEIYSGNNPNVSGGMEYEATFDNDVFYQEYRLRMLSSHGGASGYGYITLNVVRLSGDIKKQ